MYMQLYHKIFIVLKVAIVLLFLISKLQISSYNRHLEEVIEDIFAVYVGIIVIFVFWPWSNRHNDKHDKMMVLSAGILLLLTKNYYKLYTEVTTLLKNIYMTIEVPTNSL
jgi:hypothetical protein